MTFGERLKRLREVVGWSQNELARRSGVPRPTISDLEAGKQRGLTVANARKLARALGVSLDLLIGPEEDEDVEHPWRCWEVSDARLAV
jgi:transcriptional regulator with XRE-family HTH domain